MKISIVIPVLNEEHEIAGAIESAAVSASTGTAHPSSDAAAGIAPNPVTPNPVTRKAVTPNAVTSNPVTPNAVTPVVESNPLESNPVKGEVWVVDGGSGDQTVARARAAGARLLVSGQGRARQLQSGVEASDGDVVLFLHADTRLPAGWERSLMVALEAADVCGGAFRFRFAGERDWRLRLIEAGANWRASRLGLPYGDQAIFVRRSVLEALGGVPQTPLMEDLDLVRAMKRRGRLVLLRLPALTSSRRYRAAGPLTTALRHVMAALAWGAGIDRQRIADWYARRASSPGLSTGPAQSPGSAGPGTTAARR